MLRRSEYSWWGGGFAVAVPLMFPLPPSDAPALVGLCVVVRGVARGVLPVLSGVVVRGVARGVMPPCLRVGDLPLLPLSNLK